MEYNSIIPAFPTTNSPTASGGTVDGFKITVSTTQIQNPNNAFDKNNSTTPRSSILPVANEYIQMTFPKEYFF